MQQILQFVDICFAYEREVALHNGDLDAPERSLVAVIGPNREGKSALIKLALGVLFTLFDRPAARRDRASLCRTVT
jgi:ABC-type Mn2+/Zn2+ transport system ATPase subunit